jgi:hypothetical protein
MKLTLRLAGVRQTWVNTSLIHNGISFREAIVVRALSLKAVAFWHSFSRRRRTNAANDR